MGERRPVWERRGQGTTLKRITDTSKVHRTMRKNKSERNMVGGWSRKFVVGAEPWDTDRRRIREYNAPT